MIQEQSALMPGLYVVATPIGNLGDITLRALEVLKQVACVAAEDTRVSRQLLQHYGLRKEMMSVREHNEQQSGDVIVGRIRNGEAIAYMTDAGTPAISDPGARLVSALHRANLPVVPLPGPNAALAALSASGQVLDHWMFYGFLPAKDAGRRNALKSLGALPYGIVFYESPHRILATVGDMAAILGGTRTLTIARELSKRFEQIHSLPLGDAEDWLRGDADRQRGEFVLVVSAQQQAPQLDDAEEKRVLTLLLEELPISRAATLASRILGTKKHAMYQLALGLKQEHIHE